ncbi:hypothetical protein AMAG_18664 [Allomyces macrogynus ATCC 38327]|uniref:Uncharacterized protein n=1 Tax=Allomyces macrogynus (strain ATCC 38327) TaxID=578462 RepID=A0A0L0SGR9_ALLM3|nr:hypothetical protein AMAG_18664 [Allomyces macrogynus ATCC 38327]|eukprot:KNE61644.1 hypothetical protein AMAG_18664 [Allomyces macrogynus ATCC 38327]
MYINAQTYLWVRQARSTLDTISPRVMAKLRQRYGRVGNVVIDGKRWNMDDKRPANRHQQDGRHLKTKARDLIMLRFRRQTRVPLQYARSVVADGGEGHGNDE